jgi:hypothetical protein
MCKALGSIPSIKKKEKGTSVAISCRISVGLPTLSYGVILSLEPPCKGSGFITNHSV